MNSNIFGIIMCTVCFFTLFGIIFATSNIKERELNNKWDTCVSQQKVEGAPYEEFMKECVK